MDDEMIRILEEKVYGRAFTLAYKIEKRDWDGALRLLKELCDICKRLRNKPSQTKLSAFDEEQSRLF